MDIITYALCMKSDKRLYDLITSMDRVTMVVVDSVPTVEEAESNKIYLVDTNHDGVYEEYVLAEIDGEPQIVELGSITDLSNYYNKTEVDSALANKENLIEVVTQQQYEQLTPAQLQEDKAYIVIIDSTHAEVYKKGRLFGTTVAEHITYDNTGTGVAASNVQGAISELDADISTVASEIVPHEDMTQEQYDAIENPDGNTVYFINDTEAEGDFSNIESRMEKLEKEFIVYYLDGNYRIPLYTENVKKVIKIDNNTVDWYIDDPDTGKHYKATVTAEGQGNVRTNPQINVVEVV